MLKFIKNELFMGYTTFEKFFFPLLILLQVVAFYFNPENIIGLIAGMSGVICVIMVAKSRISNYFWGLIQVSAYLYISWQAFFLGEVVLNVFYLVAQFVGFYMWSKHMRKSDLTDKVEEVVVKGLTKKQWVLNIVAIGISWYGFSLFLEYIGSNNPYVDSITTTLSVFAQLHMLKRLSSQWVLWILVNVFTILLWSSTSDWSMIALWTGFLLNSIYGYVLWSKKVK